MTSEHEIETFLSVQSRLACLSGGMQVEVEGPLIEELEKLSVLPFVSFPFKNTRYRPGEVEYDPAEVTIFIANESAGTLANPDVDLILEKSTASAFGKGDKTIIDEEFRSGREIHAADIQMEPKKPWISDKIVENIGAKVSATMFAGRKVVPKLYKLTVYKDRGHFDWHMDSTHSDQHHATVLLVLNTSWVGGDLLLRRNDVETRIDMKPKTARKWPQTVLQAVAFYTDTEHKVEPVSEGVRIALQYDVDVKGWNNRVDRKRERDDENESEDNKNEDEDEGSDDYIDESLLEWVGAIYNERQPYQGAASISGDPAIIKNIMVIIRNMLKSGVEELGFATQYLYRKSSVLPEFLKGTDAVLYQALVANFDVSLHPIVLEEKSNCDGGYDENSTCYAYRFDHVGSKGNGGNPELVANASDSDDEPEDNLTETIFYVSTVSAVMKISSEKYLEYTGNEAQPAEHKYFGGGMFVRRRKIV